MGEAFITADLITHIFQPDFKGFEIGGLGEGGVNIRPQKLSVRQIAFLLQPVFFLVSAVK